MKRIVEINELANGGHRNQTAPIGMDVPIGWAVIPDDVGTENFPFGKMEVEKINGVMTVTKWIAGEVPKAEEPETLEGKMERLINTLYKADKLTDEEYKELMSKEG